MSCAGEGSAEGAGEGERAARPTLSTSTSSPEPLDPHDPGLSRLAADMFRRTADYLDGELTSTRDHYTLLEEMNRATSSKYSDMKQITTNLSRTINDYNEMYTTTIEPYLKQIDIIEENVNKLERAAFKLDNYTKELKIRLKNIEKR